MSMNPATPPRSPEEGTGQRRRTPIASPNTDLEKGGKPKSAPPFYQIGARGSNLHRMRKAANIQRGCQAKGCAKIGKLQHIAKWVYFICDEHNRLLTYDEQVLHRANFRNPAQLVGQFKLRHRACAYLARCAARHALAAGVTNRLWSVEGIDRNDKWLTMY